MPDINPSVARFEFESVEDLVRLFHRGSEDPEWPQASGSTDADPLLAEEVDELVRMIAVRQRSGPRSPSAPHDVMTR